MIWNNINKLGLSVNKRVIKNGNTLEARQFTEFLTDVGDHSKNLGKINNTDLIKVPALLFIPPNLPETPNSLKMYVYRLTIISFSTYPSIHVVSANFELQIKYTYCMEYIVPSLINY